MKDVNIVRIIPAADKEKISACARMMTLTDPWITLGFNYGNCIKAFEGSCKEIFILESGEEIIGFVIMQTCGTFSGYIQTICISEKYRGMGFGTRILKFCEERILQCSPNVFICVSSFNTRAANLYFKYGFKLVGELENFIVAGYTELLLRKTVGPRTAFMLKD